MVKKSLQKPQVWELQDYGQKPQRNFTFMNSASGFNQERNINLCQRVKVKFELWRILGIRKDKQKRRRTNNIEVMKVYKTRVMKSRTREETIGLQIFFMVLLWCTAVIVLTYFSWLGWQMFVNNWRSKHSASKKWTSPNASSSNREQRLVINIRQSCMSVWFSI